MFFLSTTNSILKLLLVQLLFLFIGFSYLLAQSDSTCLRVMSYNIHYGKGMDGVYNLKNISDVINKAQPDLVGLQEIADSAMASELAISTGMNFIFGPSLGSSSGYGDAILSKYPFTWVSNHSLPSASSSRYQAMAVDVDLSFMNKKVTKLRFINTHFDWLSNIGSEHARLASVDLLEEAFFKKDEPVPAIMTGDLNSIPQSRVLAKLINYGWEFEGDTNRNFTYSSINPTKQIDYVLIRSENYLSIKNVYVMYGEISSDHLPIIMEVQLNKENMKK